MLSLDLQLVRRANQRCFAGRKTIEVHGFTFRLLTWKRRVGRGGLAVSAGFLVRDGLRRWAVSRCFRAAGKDGQGQDEHAGPDGTRAALHVWIRV
jgi:hypothetical protein